MAGRCTECGTYHHDGPPCDNCGAVSFQPAEEVKECAECGKIHRDESPPCNRCGAMGFRPVNPDDLGDDGTNVESVEASTVTRRQLLYGAGAAVVVAAGGYTFLSGDDLPTNEAPGDPDEASGIRFETVETELRGLINDERESEGAGTLETAGNVEAFATYYNKEFVKTGGDPLDNINSEGLDGDFNVSDYYAAGNHFGDDYDGRAIDYYDSASDLARDCFDSWMGEDRFRDPLTAPQYQRIGLDVHLDETGDIFLLVVVD